MNKYGTRVGVEDMMRSGMDESTAVARFHFENGLERFSNAEFPSAVMLFRLAVRFDDQQPEYHRHLALALHHHPMWGWRAEEALLRAVELEPEHAETHYFLGRIYLEEGLTNQARSRFEESLRIKPGLEPAKLELSVMNGMPQAGGEMQASA